MALWWVADFELCPGPLGSSLLFPRTLPPASALLSFSEPYLQLSPEGSPRATEGPGCGQTFLQSDRNVWEFTNPQETLPRIDPCRPRKAQLPLFSATNPTVSFMLQSSPWPQAGTWPELTYSLDFSVHVCLPPSLAGFFWAPSLVTAHTHTLVSGFASAGPPGGQKIFLGERQ